MNHAQIDQRSLAFGRAIAAHLAAQPELVAQAQDTLARWMTTSSPGVCRSLFEWKMVLDGPIAGVLQLLTGTDERATRLRQSNPFTGVLSQQERNQILQQFASHDPARA